MAWFGVGTVSREFSVVATMKIDDTEAFLAIIRLATRPALFTFQQFQDDFNRNRQR